MIEHKNWISDKEEKLSFAIEYIVHDYKIN